MPDERAKPESVTLSRIIAALESGVSVNSEDRPARDGEPGVLKVSAVSDGQFFPDENKVVLPGERSRLVVSPKKGDLLISRANTFDLIAACGLVDRDYPNLYLPDKLWRVVLADPRRDDMHWLKHVLNSPSVRSELKARASGTSGSMKNISKEAFLGITVVRPDLDEQRRIAEILDCWDESIRQASALREIKVRYYRGLAQLLITGKHRFREFAGHPWQEVRLADVTVESSQRNGTRLSMDAVMAVTKAEGMVPMKEETIGASLDRYKVVRRDWFAYNPMRVNIGSIARWAGETDVLVSPDYVVFRCKTEADAGLFDQQDGGSPTPLLDPSFLDHFRRSRAWEQFVAASGNGSVRVRIYFDDLGELRLRLPTLEEQKRIAAVLDTLDREISLLRSELKALKQQKKGLMQKLLTGEIRVKVRP